METKKRKKIKLKKNNRWDAIYRRIKNIEYPLVAEIGVNRAYNAKELLRLHPGMWIALVDMWSRDTYKGKGVESVRPKYLEIYTGDPEANFKTASDNVKQYEGRYRFFKGDSVQTADMFPDAHFDLVFIDADHGYEGCKADLMAWMPKVKPGGWLCGHDYPRYQGVERAANELVNHPRVTVWELDVDFTFFCQIS